MEEWPEWKDIETAPKDGTWVLLGTFPLFKGGRGSVAIGQWVEANMRFGDRDDGEPGWCGYFEAYGPMRIRDPDRWMPLPHAPELPSDS